MQGRWAADRRGWDPVERAQEGRDAEDEGANSSLPYNWADSIRREICWGEGVEHQSATMGAWHEVNFQEAEPSVCSPHQQGLWVKQDYLVAEKRFSHHLWFLASQILGPSSPRVLDCQKLLGFHSSSGQSVQKKHQVCCSLPLSVCRHSPVGAEQSSLSEWSDKGCGWLHRHQLHPCCHCHSRLDVKYRCCLDKWGSFHEAWGSGLAEWGFPWRKGVEMRV